MTIVRVDSLSVALGGLPILKDISFEIAGRQTVALQGGNGSGKTTLLRAILGLARHQSGQVQLFGTAIERFTAWQDVGYVPQRATVSLHSTTVAEIVASGVLANRAVGWPGKADRAKIAWALAAVGLSGHESELYLHLSGGQQQRVLIARGIVNQPRLLLMDEPFAGVDLASQQQIAQTLAAIEATRLIVLHETEAMAGQLDRTLVLSQGRLIHDGPPGGHDRPSWHASQPPARPQLLTGMEPRWNS